MGSAKYFTLLLCNSETGMDYRNPRGPIYAAIVNLRTTSLPPSLSLPHEVVELCEVLAPSKCASNERREEWLIG